MRPKFRISADANFSRTATLLVRNFVGYLLAHDSVTCYTRVSRSPQINVAIVPLAVVAFHHPFVNAPTNAPIGRSIRQDTGP